MGEDKFKIDGEKIFYHKDRIEEWLEGSKKVYPIYMEVTPFGGCNHKCKFCAVDYLGYKTESLDEHILGERLSEMGELGIRSIMYAGEGEPLLHKGLSRIISNTKNSGIDVSITTNATPLTEKFVEESIVNVTWIKASIDAGKAETYAKVHGTREEAFEFVWRNLENAIKIRQKYSLNPVEHTFGAQMLLLPENADEAIIFAKRAKDIGLDYAVIKPYSQHKKSETHIYENISYDKYMEIDDELKELNSKNFETIFRKKTMNELKKDKPEYPKCLSTPHFWAYIMANGDVYGCSAYLGDKKFCYGNINENSFKEIWLGEKRMENMDYVNRVLDIGECRRNCRMNHVNNSLWKVVNGEIKLGDIDITEDLPHKNFI